MQLAIWTLWAVSTMTCLTADDSGPPSPEIPEVQGGQEAPESQCFDMEKICEAFKPKHRTPANCAEALEHSGRRSGVHRIKLPNSELGPFFVYCLADPQEGARRAWTLLLRRMNGKIDFHVPWSDYEHGFGNLNGDFFLGLDKIHALTHSALHELWIDMWDFEGERRSANYTAFVIGNADEVYPLNMLGTFTGDAGDSFTRHLGMKFTTQDNDNDTHENRNCALKCTGGWWYYGCHMSLLTGRYLRGQYSTQYYCQGINWSTWHGFYYSLKYAHMAIRHAL